MSVLNIHSGILDDWQQDGWLAESRRGQMHTRVFDQVDQLIEDLARIAEVEVLVHSLCVMHMARCGLTSWDGGESALKFWCHGVDATLRWDVSANPMEPSDPPLCLLSVILNNEKSHAVYRGVVADLRGGGLLLLSHAIASLISQVLRYEAG